MDWSGLRRDAQIERAPIVGKGAPLDWHRGHGFGVLSFDHLVAGPHRFKAVAGTNVKPALDRGARDHRFRRRGIESPIESHPKNTRRLGPRQNRLGRGFGDRSDFENPALALGAGAPIGIASVSGDEERAARADREVHGELVQAGDGFRVRHVPGFGLDQLRAPDFPARFSGDQGIARPPRRPERLSAIDRCIEAQTARRLVLRAIVVNARLVDDVRQMLRVARRESVVPALFDEEEFIEWVSVRQPGCALLVGAEEIAVVVEPQADRPADAGAEFFAGFEIRGDAQDGAAFGTQVVVSYLRLIEFIGVVVPADAEPEQNRAVLRVITDARGIDAGAGERPAFSQHAFLLGLAIAIAIGDHHDSPFAGEENRVAVRRSFGREVHPNRRGDLALPLPKQIGVILEAIVIRVRQQPDVPVIPERDELPVVAVLQIHQVRQLDRQLLHRKPRHQHLHDRRRILRPHHPARPWLRHGRNGQRQQKKQSGSAHATEVWPVAACSQGERGNWNAGRKGCGCFSDWQPRTPQDRVCDGWPSLLRRSMAVPTMQAAMEDRRSLLAIQAMKARLSASALRLMDGGFVA